MRRLRRALPLLALWVAASGCDETFVDPFLRDAPPYSLYGYVVADDLALVQQVRVQNIRAIATPPSDASEPGARVEGRMTSPDPQTGAEVVWGSRLVTYDDATVGTVFEREFRPLPDSRFEIRFEDPIGRVVTADVVTPPTPPGTLFEPLLVDSAQGNYRQRIVWEGARFLPEAQVFYQGGTFEDGAEGFFEVVPLTILADGRVELDIDLSAGLRRLATMIPATENNRIPDLKMRAKVTSLTDRIPPNDVIPTEDLGRTFIQGATTGTVAWIPDVPVYPQ